MGVFTRKRRAREPVAAAKNRRDSALSNLRTPVPTTDQDEQRRRRRSNRSVVYTGTFDLTAEVEAVLAPVSVRPEVARYPHVVDHIAGATYELALELGDLLAEREARHRAEGRAAKLLVAARTRPSPPTIERAAIVSGQWATTIVDLARPLSEPLSAYLTVALPPGQTRGALSVSERVEAALRGLDRAVLSAHRTLDRAESARVAAAAATPVNHRLRHLGASETELRALGIRT